MMQTTLTSRGAAFCRLLFALVLTSPLLPSLVLGFLLQVPKVNHILCIINLEFCSETGGSVVIFDQVSSCWPT